jgi:prepilin-type N-terminal cleavage/methylation domain-containing protein
MKRKGFTLIELMIVIAIIAIIAAVAIPSLLASKKAAATTRALGGLRAYLNAQAIYQTKRKTYGVLDDLVTLGGLDTLIGAAISATVPGYAGYWFDDTGSANLKYNYQCLCTPQTGDVGTTIYLTNETGNIYSRLVELAAVHSGAHGIGSVRVLQT